MQEIKQAEEFYNKEGKTLKVTAIEPIKKIKWNILINQKSIIENNLNINIIEAAIFNFIYDFISSGCSQCKVINNKNYHWIAYQYIIDAMPLLKINNKEVISRHINGLVKSGLLYKYIDRKDNNKTYFAMGFMVSNLFFGISNNTNRLNNREPIDYSVESLSTKKSNNTSINNTSINDTYLVILEHWNSKKIYKHSEEIFLLALMKKEKDLINLYTIDVVKKAIDNYAEVLLSDQYYWTYRWSLIDFINRGLSKFIDDAEPLLNFKKDKNDVKMQVYEKDWLEKNKEELNSLG